MAKQKTTSRVQGRTVSTIYGTLILGVVAALAILTIAPLVPDQYLKASPLARRSPPDSVGAVAGAVDGL